MAVLGLVAYGDPLDPVTFDHDLLGVVTYVSDKFITDARDRDQETR